MNSKQQKALRAVFARPTRSDIPWSDIEALFRSLGAIASKGSGSRIRVELNGVRAVYHRPHPGRFAKKGMVEAVRDHLTAAGIEL